MSSLLTNDHLSFFSTCHTGVCKHAHACTQHMNIHILWLFFFFCFFCFLAFGIHGVASQLNWGGGIVAVFPSSPSCWSRLHLTQKYSEGQASIIRKAMGHFAKGGSKGEEGRELPLKQTNKRNNPLFRMETEPKLLDLSISLSQAWVPVRLVWDFRPYGKLWLRTASYFQPFWMVGFSEWKIQVQFL